MNLKDNTKQLGNSKNVPNILQVGITQFLKYSLLDVQPAKKSLHWGNIFLMQKSLGLTLIPGASGNARK